MGCCISQQVKSAKRAKIIKSKTKRRNLSIKQGNFVKLLECDVTKNYDLGEIWFEDGNYEFRTGIEKKTGIQRAIKSILVGANSSYKIDHILSEVEVLRKLDHPSIIKVYEVYHHNLHLHIITELCTGGELFEKMGQMESFSENQAAKFMREIIFGIKHCHSVGVVHGDLRPENVLFENESADAKLKIVGFERAQFIKPNGKLTKFTGTSYFAAPEMILGSYDNKCDIWSLGIILYIMLSGLAPYKAKSEQSLYRKIQEKPVSFEFSAWNGISKEAKDLIKWMLKKKPSNRPTIDEVSEHKWIRQRANNSIKDNPIVSKSLANLACFNICNKLQKATLTFITSYLSTNTEIAHLSEIFQALDENGDGKLSEEELTKGFENNHQLMKIDVHELMKNCDSDNNGYIDYSEFLAAAMNWRKTLSKEKLYQVFKVYDIDGSGKISLEELKQSLGGNDSNHLELLDILKEADTNGDGEIDFDEFSEIMLSKLAKHDNANEIEYKKHITSEIFFNKKEIIS
ncbi:unnamed protein product [Blepharisma stoltei]|uniref:Calcium-dependent protein kinase n=1 Tax=Blepharisma stoltei TaxID=1481888 RepID=A0AAU9JZK0_9CILI|nr:unnamed protein product [Blepharisma stoltei]